MRHLIPALAVVLTSCEHRLEDVDPYAGFNHPSAEHGYWAEVGDASHRIRELHLHSKGFSVTYEPFETYKDYWGTYSCDPVSGIFHLSVESGNAVPEFKGASGTIRMPDAEHLTISGIRLDGRRSRSTTFKFLRFTPNRN